MSISPLEAATIKELLEELERRSRTLIVSLMTGVDGQPGTFDSYRRVFYREGPFEALGLWDALGERIRNRIRDETQGRSVE